MKERLLELTITLPSLPIERKPQEDNYKHSTLELVDDFLPCPSSEFSYFNDFENSGWVGELNLDMVISLGILEGASDVHLTADQPIAYTILGDIQKRYDLIVPDEDMMHDLVIGILSNVQHSIYIKDLDFDSSYEVKHGRFEGARLRCNLGKSFGKDFAVFRIISDDIPTPEELAIEDEIMAWTKLTSSGCLICGPTGQGKSTTLASMINHVNLNERKKIVTIEKPIEYLYKDDGMGYVVQRSVPDDCLTFQRGLDFSLRQNPDIILIGESRNAEEVSEFVRGAETGHLVFSTMHTKSVATTISRIISLYEGSEQERIKATLADVLAGVANQTLVRTADGNSRFAVREIMTVNNKVRNFILKGDSQGIRRYMYDNEMLMEQKLVKELHKGTITMETARSHSPDLETFEAVLSGRTSDDLFGY